MQKPLQEYTRGLYGGYTSEATRKINEKENAKQFGEGGELSMLPFVTANPLELALRLTQTDKMVPKPLSMLPSYLDENTMNMLKAMLTVPLSANTLGAEIRQPAPAPAVSSTNPPVSPSAQIAMQREGQLQTPTEGEKESRGSAGAPATSPAVRKPDLRNLWAQLNALSVSIPDAKRRQAFVANEIERMKAEGEVDEKSAMTLHNWNNNINAVQEERGIDDRLLWLLMIASMFQR